MSSLPVPLSPTIITDASVDATFRARSTARRNDGDAPSSVSLSLLPLRSSSVSRAESSSRRASTACAARPNSTWRCVPENGFGM